MGTLGVAHDYRRSHLPSLHDLLRDWANCILRNAWRMLPWMIPQYVWQTLHAHICVYMSSSLHLQKSIQKLILHKCYMNLAFTLAMQRSTKTTFGAASDRKQSCEGMEVLEPHDSHIIKFEGVLSRIDLGMSGNWGLKKQKCETYTTQPEWG